MASHGFFAVGLDEHAIVGKYAIEIKHNRRDARRKLVRFGSLAAGPHHRFRSEQVGRFIDFKAPLRRYDVQNGLAEETMLVPQKALILHDVDGPGLTILGQAILPERS